METQLPYVTQWYFRAGNRVSGPDFGRILGAFSVLSRLGPCLAVSCDEGCSQGDRLAIMLGNNASGPEIGLPGRISVGF